MINDLVTALLVTFAAGIGTELLVNFGSSSEGVHDSYSAASTGNSGYSILLVALAGALFTAIGYVVQRVVWPGHDRIELLISFSGRAFAVRGKFWQPVRPGRGDRHAVGDEWLGRSWHDTVYDSVHYHSQIHEVGKTRAVMRLLSTFLSLHCQQQLFSNYFNQRHTSCSRVDISGPDSDTVSRAFCLEDAVVAGYLSAGASSGLASQSGQSLHGVVWMDGDL